VRTAVSVATVLLLVCASAAGAADINGRWHGQVPRGGGLTDYYFDFKVEGSKLSGTVVYPQGDNLYRMPIQEGKVSGDDFSFTVMNSMGSSQVKWTFRGKAGEKVLQLELERPPMTMGPPPQAGAAPGGAPPAAPAPAAGAPAAAPQIVTFTVDRTNRLPVD
jgi:hypothetical protein